MAAQGEDPSSLFRFWARLQKNPSYRSVHQLFGFLKNKGIPITADGCFLAYKSVTYNYKDHHSGQFDNSPGRINEMPRNEISDEPNQTCDPGFHVGALEYAQSFGSGNRRIVVCKIDPENVVSVPSDHSAQKMRVCKYHVVGNHGVQLPSTTFNEPVPFYDDIEEKVEATPVEAAEDTVEETKTVGRDTSVTVGTATSTKKRKKDPYEQYKHMGMAELVKLSIAELREYAYQGLHIVGASKIPGGKTMLIGHILNVRDGVALPKD